MDLALLGRLLMAFALTGFKQAQIIGQFFEDVQWLSINTKSHGESWFTPMANSDVAHTSAALIDSGCSTQNPLPDL